MQSVNLNAGKFTDASSAENDQILPCTSKISIIFFFLHVGATAGDPTATDVFTELCYDHEVKSNKAVCCYPQ